MFFVFELNGFSPVTNSIAISNNTNAEPSFNNDSPSIKVAKRFDAPRSRNNATTATGSVADTIAPKVIALKHAYKFIFECGIFE